MKRLCTASLAMILLASAPAAAAAQRVGQMPAPAPREQVQPQPERHGSYHRRVPAPVRYIVLNDGTIIADLGWGYEQVVRSCAVTGAQPQTWVTYPAAAPQRSGSQPSGNQPAPGWQPAPGQQAAPGQQPAPRQPVPQQPSQVSRPPQYRPPPHPNPQHVAPVVTSRPAPCWVRDGYGNLVIVNR
jgi:hypothetical protein